MDNKRFHRMLPKRNWKCINRRRDFERAYNEFEEIAIKTLEALLEPKELTTVKEVEESATVVEVELKPKKVELKPKKKPLEKKPLWKRVLGLFGKIYE